MSVKLALLKSGEEVIADIKELVSEDEKLISLVFTNPYLVKLVESEILSDDFPNNDIKYAVNFSPWIPLSIEKDIAVSMDWIVTIVEPTKEVKKSYEERMNGKSSISDPNN